MAGTVQGLSTTTLGAVVAAGAQLLTVVPQGDVLRAEAVLANDDIGLQLAYKAVIELAAQNLELPNGKQLRLTPGMAATIEIHQGRRTVMEYLVESGAAGD